MGLRLLVNLPPPARHLAECFGRHGLGQFGIGPKSADAVEDCGFDRLRRNGLRLTVLPTLLLRVVANVVTVALRLPHRVRVHHRSPARHAEQQAAQQRAVLVFQAGTVVAIVASQGLMDAIPSILIDDPLVLTRVQSALVVDHPRVDDIGEDPMHRPL